MWMESEPGAGSTFSFSIPLLAVAATGAVDAPELSEDAALILVIEDDRSSAGLLRVYLEDAGYAVAVARDGVEGLELARRSAPSAVILDLLLPKLNGWELIAQLKDDPATSGLPLVIVSMVDEQGAGFALGVDEYLVKPVARPQLLDALSRCIPGSRAGRTVVAIDDDAIDLDLLEAVLAPEGWVVVRATGGEEGVRAVRRERPAVVVLDLLMPGVDGFAVVDQLRADPLVGDVPIVVLTSKDVTRADQERLNGRITALARKGACGHAELVDLIGRVAAPRGAAEGQAT
jgi:CheY-like chemotaxis protein